MSRGRRVRGPWHVPSVNAYVSRLRGLMQRFKGVAAKYLGSYLGWFRLLDRSGPMGPQDALVLGQPWKVTHHQHWLEDPEIDLWRFIHKRY